MTFNNCYEDETRAAAYSTLEFRNTYYLAYRDLPAILREHVNGRKSVDFGCGTGRSTRFLRQLGFEVTGVDIAENMIRKARELDPSGDYRLVPEDDLGCLEAEAHDLVLSAFTFDNIAGADEKVRILRDLGSLLKQDGKIVQVVSRPEIYTREWASFSTHAFPGNRSARSGERVRIVVTDHGDPRPVEDILWTDGAYREVFDGAGLHCLRKYEPLAQGNEPFAWRNETQIAPWAIYVLRRG